MLDPVAAGVGVVPRWASFDHRDGVLRDLGLDADLVVGFLGTRCSQYSRMAARSSSETTGQSEVWRSGGREVVAQRLAYDF